MATKPSVKQQDEVEEDPLHEVTSAEVERMDGVLGAANGHGFLLMRSEKPDDVDLLDAFLKTKQLQRSAAASGGKKARAGSKHKLMVDGQVKFPINDCSDVQDAWGLRGHATGVSQSAVESYIRGAAKAEGCSIPGEEEGQTKRSFSKEPEAQEALEEAATLTRIGKTISAATESRIRATMDQLAGLLADSNAPAILPEGVDADMATQDKAGDKQEAHDVGTEKTTPPLAPVQRAKNLGYDSVEDLISAVERAQAPKIGSTNNPGYGGDPSDVNSPSNLPSSQPVTGVGGPSAGVVKPQADVKDATGAMAKAVGQTEANVKQATEEEELPDQAERIARSIGTTIKQAFEEGFKPLKETLDKIASEDSRGQQRPFLRGAGPRSDFHLVQRDGNLEVNVESEQLARALEALDPSMRDVVTRELAKNQHPLLANKQ